MPSFSHRLHRGMRKALRPLRRKLAGAPEPALLGDFQGPALILIAHPDDEVFCSGLICQLRSRDIPVHLISFTRGEGGERGDLPADANLGLTRQGELQAAAEILDVSSLTFLDYQDPSSRAGNLTDPEHDPTELTSELQSHLERTQATALVTHGSGGEYWHPAHLCLHRQGRILSRLTPSLQFWTFNAWNAQHPLPGVLNRDDPTNLSIDSAEFHDTRLQALAAHHSQRSVFENFSAGSLADFITQTSRENYRKW